MSRRKTPSAQLRFTKKGFSRKGLAKKPSAPRKKTATGARDAEVYDDVLDKSCAFEREAGRDIQQPYNTGRYRICLSQTQRDELFGNKRTPKLLGKGAAANAYDVGGGKVVKITRDPDDIAALVAAKGIRHVVKTHKIYELVNAAVDLQDDVYEPLRVWAVVAEKLEPLDDDYESLVNRVPVDYLVQHYTAARGSAIVPGSYTIGDDMRRRMKSYACDSDNGTACRKFMTEYLDTFQALGRRGVVFQDAHPGNFAQTRAGKWKIIDLGLSDTQMAPPSLPRLEGVFTGRLSPRYHLRMPKVAKLK